MQYEVVFHKQPGYGIVIAHGVAEVEEFRGMADAIIAHEEFGPGVAILFDFTDLDIGDLSTIDVRSIARILTSQESRFRKGRWAILVGSPLCFGMVRMLCSFIYGKIDVSANVFMDSTFAVRWLESDRPVEVAD